MIERPFGAYGLVVAVHPRLSPGVIKITPLSGLESKQNSPDEN
jgi:hypothetical protein